MSHDKVSEVATALGAIFADDPFYRAITPRCGPDADRRSTCLGRYFQCALDEGREIGRVDVAEADGAAIWITSDDPDRVADAHARKLAALADVLGPAGLDQYRRIVDWMTANLPTQRWAGAWYLSVLGVAKHRRGAGLAGQLLAPTLAAADAEGRACYLETFNARSLAMYARLGFDVGLTAVEPVTTAEYWVMVRPPRAD